MKRTLPEAFDLLKSDLRYNRGRRLAHGVAWRARRVRNRVLGSRRRGSGGQPDRIYSVSFGPKGEHVMAELRQAVSDGSLPLMFGGGGTAQVVHVEDLGLEALGEHLLRAGAGQLCFLRVRGKWRRPLNRESVERAVARGRTFELLVVESVTGGVTPHLRCSRVSFAVWTARPGAYGKHQYESSSSFAIVGRIREKTFRAFMESGHDFDLDLPAPTQPMFDVDIVYTWVDGDDPVWQAEKERHQSADSSRLHDRVVHDERFRSRDELKYSLRSIELFAPWVRKIHIVTADQRPPWLDVDHPKINLVNHQDIYADPAWLPTFNSSGIETQLHRIPGLAQKFLYFNDDFFLGQLTTKGDFFHQNGIVKFFRSDQRAFELDIDGKSEEYIQADRNAIELLRRDLPAVGRAIMMHVPYPADRDLLFEMEGKWAEEFARCASSKFRSGDDLRPIAFMQYHYGYAHKLAMPSNISHRYLALWKDTIIDQMQRVEERRSFKTFCINDVGLQAERTAEINEAVVQFLDRYYPTPSRFELTGAT